jgi:hypothetical protein
MKIKTSELTGAALDWAVAKCEGVSLGSFKAAVAWMKRREPSDDELEAHHAYQYSTSWHAGGPIIEREKIELRHDGRSSWCAWIASTGAVHGPTPLIAAMRCRVASKLGDEVDVPEELL